MDGTRPLGRGPQTAMHRQMRRRLLSIFYRTFRNQDQQVQATFRFRVSDPSQPLA